MKNPSITSNNEVSGGQIESCVTLVADATRKATGVVLRELVKNGVLNKQNVEQVRARGNEVVVAITELVKSKFAEIAENIAGIVKLISGAEMLELDETDGKETIAEAKETFSGWIDGDFKNYGTDVKSSPTKKINVSVHEMIKDGTFAQIFGGMSDNLDGLCLTQPQIIQFVKKHRKWLRADGWSTFFLFKVKSEFFVARVHVRSDGQLCVSVYRFSDVGVWYADYRYRLVVSAT